MRGGGIDVEESITFECPRPKSRSSREPSKKSGLSMADAADHFARADTDGDGVITQKELAAYATEVAEEARRSEMMADDDDVEGGARRRSGSPSWPAAMREASTVQLPAALVSAISSNMTRLLQLFAVWDTDGDGTISPREFERALLQLSIQTQPADRSKLFRLIDADGSGDIRVEELIALKVAIEGARRDKARRRTVALCEAKAAGADAATLAEMSRAMTQSSSHSFIKDSGLGELTESIGGRRVVVQGDTGEKIKGACSTLRNLLVKPMLGALWKQPLQPHHALSLEPDWHEMADEAFDVHGKHHFHYEPGLVPSVREHVLKCQAGLQEGCSQATHELGELLSEVRQADLKLMELRLSQRKQAKEEEDVVSRFSVYLQYLAADLERALINIERYALPLRGPEAPKRGKSGRMITDNARAADVARRCSFADFKGGAKASAPAADHGRRGDEGLGQRTDPDGGLFGAEFATAAHGLAGAPIARWLDKFAPLPGQKKQLRCVAQVYLGLVAAWVIVTLIGFALDVRVGVRETCELYHYVCAAPWGVNNDTYICGLGGPDNDTITVAPASCDAAGLMVRAAVDALNGTSLAATTAACSTAMSTSWLYILPLPLDVAISVWPTRMWRRNMHNKAVRKLILWTPTVPLVLLQLLMRAAVLCSVARYSQDLTFAIVNAVEGFALLLQTFVFIFMDAQKVTAPGMRSLFALTMIGRFFVSFYLRQTTIKWVEQYPLLPQTGLTAGFGTSSRGRCRGGRVSTLRAHTTTGGRGPWRTWRHSTLLAAGCWRPLAARLSFGLLYSSSLALLCAFWRCFHLRRASSWRAFVAFSRSQNIPNWGTRLCSELWLLSKTIHHHTTSHCNVTHIPHRTPRLVRLSLQHTPSPSVRVPALSQCEWLA